MQIPRLSETLLVNNLWLLGLTTLVAITVLWLGLVGGMAIIRALFRTSRVGPLVRLGDWMFKLAKTVAVVATAISIIAALALVGYSVWSGADLQAWADTLTRSLTPDVLWLLAKKCAALVVLLFVFVYFHRLGKVLLPRVEERIGRMAALKEHQAVLAKIFADLPRCLTLILAFIVVQSTSSALDLPPWPTWTIVSVSFIALIAGSSRLLIQLCYLALDLLDSYMVRRFESSVVLTYYGKVKELRPLTRRAVEAVVYVAAATLIVGRFETLGSFAPYGPMIIELIALFCLTRVVIEVVGALIYNLMLREEDPSESATEPRPSEPRSDIDAPEAHKRRVTLTHLLQRLMKYLIYIGMVLWMLIIVGVNPVPLLAGAGIVGFAVGLGSQKILQDVICGFFILFEDQMLIGDYVKIDDTEGVVEELHLRVVRIRDRLGRVHIMRNGDLANVINYSRGWTLAVVEMSVAYESDLAEVLRVMTGVGVELREQLPDKVLEPAQVMGVEAMDDSCLRVRIQAPVKPGCHYHVKWALNRLLFEAFVENDLEIPYPKGIEFDSVPDSTPRAPSG